MLQFCYDSAVRGYHVYKDVWEASLGKLLNRERETGNSFDPFLGELIFVEKSIPRKPRKFIHLENFYVYGIQLPYFVSTLLLTN